MKQTIILIGVLALISCQAYAQDTPFDMVNKRLGALSSDELQSEKGIRTMIDALRFDVVPAVSAPDKKEAKEIANIFTDLLNDKIAEPTVWAIQDATIRFFKLMVKLDPINFDNHYGLLDTYTRFATQTYFISELYGPNYQAKVDKHVDKLQKTTLKTAHQLVKDFPKEGDAYGMLAYVLFEVESNAEKAQAIAEKGLKIDKKSEHCKELIAFFKYEKNKKPGDNRRKDTDTKIIWSD